MIYLKRPVSEEFSISSPFGSRKINGKEEFHNGIDFKVPVGTEVYACEDGAAYRCGWQDETDKSKGFGLRVMQEIEVRENHDNVRYFIFYGHLSKIMIPEGERIKKGQLIGLSGNTGRSTGPHLHLGCRKRDTSEWQEIDWV